MCSVPNAWDRPSARPLVGRRVEGQAVDVDDARSITAEVQPVLPEHEPVAAAVANARWTARIDLPADLTVPRRGPHGDRSHSREDDESVPRALRSLAADAVVAVRAAIGRHDAGRRNGWARAAQVSLAIACAVFVVLGVRSVLVSPGTGASARSLFPEGLAASTAETYARAYFTFDEDDPGHRDDALTTLAASNVPADAGWNGTGRSEATSATSVGITTVDDTRATVTTVVSVRGSDRVGTDWQPRDPSVLALSIPVVFTGSRVLVSALPASVAVPDAPAARGTTVSIDEGLAGSTRALAVEYFATLGAAGPTSAADPPDATEPTGAASPMSARTTPSLGGGLTFTTLAGWRVTVPDESQGRQHAVAYADVRWATATGAELAQTYQAVLVRDDGRWRIASVSGLSS